MSNLRTVLKKVQKIMLTDVKLVCCTHGLQKKNEKLRKKKAKQEKKYK